MIFGEQELTNWKVEKRKKEEEKSYPLAAASVAV